MATYLEKAIQLENAGNLDRRVAWAIGRYAAYILSGGSQDADLIAWAKRALPGQNPALYADLMRRAIVNDSNYASASAENSDAADSALQSIVEYLVQNAFKLL